MREHLKKKKTPKQTPPNQETSPNPKSEKHPTDSRLLEQSPTQPRKLPQLDANSRARSKSARSIRIQNQLPQANRWPDKGRKWTQANKSRQRQRHHHEAGSGEINTKETKHQPRIKQSTPTRKRSTQIYRDLQISTNLKTFYVLGQS
jgi:hypothetical protein